MSVQVVQQPIPPTFYNSDYFNGITSNYTNGYAWDGLGQLFVMTARLLTWMFPEATRWLDFGAAKGFLVKALRENGKAAWGVEHSPYCLEVAEAEARPYMVPALTDIPKWCSFDVVTAFEVFEHLIPAQIAEVLPALRVVTQHALFATMPTSDMVHKAVRELAEKDQSHVTIQPRGWWLEQFEAAGWHHGPWQRQVERWCHTHPLCQQAGWSVFVLGV